MIKKINEKTPILIGNAGLSSEDKKEGYAAALCFSLMGDDYLDLFVSQEQINKLFETLKLWVSHEVKV